MKRAGFLIDRIVEPDNLRLAWLQTIRGKRDKPSVVDYSRKLDTNLKELGEQLRTNTIQWGPYGSFLIHDPKERTISVSPLRDRIAAHAIFNICSPRFDQYQIDQSYACRRGKGQYAALKQAGIYMKCNSWYLKMDIRKYFHSINHEILKAQLKRLFKDPCVLNLFELLIDSFQKGTGRGIPVGNLSSQYFANHYLGLMDHYVKEKLHCRCYIRYMDDFVLWSTDRKTITQWRSELESFLAERLCLELKPVVQNRTDKGLPFLGYRLWANGIRLASRSRLRFRRKYKEHIREFKQEKITESELAQRVTALWSFVQHGETKEYCRRVIGTE